MGATVIDWLGLGLGGAILELAVKWAIGKAVSEAGWSFGPGGVFTAVFTTHAAAVASGLIALTIFTSLSVACGRSPGKAAMRLRIAHGSGRSSGGVLLYRDLVKWWPFVGAIILSSVLELLDIANRWPASPASLSVIKVLLGAIGILSLLGWILAFGNERRALHDRLAGTRIVSDRDSDLRSFEVVVQPPESNLAPPRDRA